MSSDVRKRKNENDSGSSNERIARTWEHSRFAPSSVVFVLRMRRTIECTQMRCELTLDEYQDVRVEATWFVILPGHESPDVERIIERRAGYYVVERSESPPRSSRTGGADGAWGLAVGLGRRRGEVGPGGVSIICSRRQRRSSRPRPRCDPATGMAASAPRIPASSAPTSTAISTASAESWTCARRRAAGGRGSRTAGRRREWRPR